MMNTLKRFCLVPNVSRVLASTNSLHQMRKMKAATTLPNLTQRHFIKIQLDRAQNRSNLLWTGDMLLQMAWFTKKRLPWSRKLAFYRQSPIIKFLVKFDVQVKTWIKLSAILKWLSLKWTTEERRPRCRSKTPSQRYSSKEVSSRCLTNKKWMTNQNQKLLSNKRKRKAFLAA